MQISRFCGFFCRTVTSRNVKKWITASREAQAAAAVAAAVAAAAYNGNLGSKQIQQVLSQKNGFSTCEEEWNLEGNRAGKRSIFSKLTLPLHNNNGQKKYPPRLSNIFTAMAMICHFFEMPIRKVW